MFDSLLESRPQRERKVPQTIISVVVHTFIFAAAIQLTRAAAQPKRPHSADIEIPLIARNDPVREPAHVMSHPSAASTPSAPTFLTITAPTSIPTSIPPIDVGETFDPSKYTGIGKEGSQHEISGPPGRDSMDLSYSRAEVDTPAEYLSGPMPKFPSALRTAGIEGSVLLRFVVGADGKPEPGSMQVVESTNRAFEDPAIAAVSASTFKPGKIRGRSVRQVVEQAVRFQLTIGG